jgi:hypothetical protein
MTEQELPFPDWQVLLVDAIREFDEGKLAEKIYKAREVVAERLQQLEQGKEHSQERTALYDALSTLRILQQGRSNPSDPT